MGIDYSIHLAVGYVLSDDELFGAFRVHKAEVAHMEDRFDPRTGEKLLPEKVIDRKAETVIEVDGTEMDEWQAANAICSKLGPGVQCWTRSDGGTDSYVVGLDIGGYRDPGVDEDWGQVSAHGEYDVVQVVEHLRDYEDLFHRIKDVLNANPGSLVVTLAWNIG